MAAETADDLRRLIKAREGKYGMAASVALAKKRLAELEAAEGSKPE